jgi:hypothetical protein
LSFRGNCTANGLTQTAMWGYQRGHWHILLNLMGDFCKKPKRKSIEGLARKFKVPIAAQISVSKPNGYAADQAAGAKSTDIEVVEADVGVESSPENAGRGAEVEQMGVP